MALNWLDETLRKLGVDCDDPSVQGAMGLVNSSVIVLLGFQSEESVREIDITHIPFPYNLDQARQLVLAEYCDVSPLAVGQRLWHCDTLDKRVARSVRLAQDEYHRLRPRDPVVAQYKTNNQARNQAHYFLTNQRTYWDALYLALHDMTFYRKYMETQEHMQNKIEERMRGKGYSAIMLGANIFIDPRELHNSSLLDTHFARRLREAYDAGAKDPWVYAVAAAAEDCAADVQVKPLSGLSSDDFMKVLDIDMRSKQYKRRDVAQQQKQDPDITALVERVIKSTGLDKERREARKTPYGSLLVDIIGSMADRVRDVYADIALAYEENGEEIDLKRIEEQTRDVIQYRIAQGWFHVTRVKQQEIDACIEDLKRQIPIRATLLSCKYGLEDGRQRTVDEVAKELGITKNAVNTKFRPVYREFNELVFDMMRQGATDQDIYLYRACA
jgi:hypothetical protein